MRNLVVGMGWLAAALGWQIAGGSEEVPDAPAAQLKQQAERHLEAQAGRLMGLAKAAFQAGDYEASRRLALAVTQLTPGNQSASELHRLSIAYGLRVSATRDAGYVRRGETVDQAIERLAGSRQFPWAEAPAGTRARAPEGPKAEEKAPWQADLEKRMAAKGSVGFKETRFSEVKEYFEALFGCPIVVDRRVRDQVMGLPVTLQAKDMPGEQAFRWVVENDLGMRYALADGAIYISNAQGITEKVGVTVAYDVEDLMYLSKMPDFEGPSLDLRDSGPGRGLDISFDEKADDEKRPAAKRGLTPERLMQIIKRTVEPGDWTDD